VKQKSYIQIARIYREHGLKGFCKVTLMTDALELLAPKKEYLLRAVDGQEKLATLEAHMPMGHFELIKFSCFDLPEPIQPWRKAGIFVLSEDLPAGKGFELFDHEWPGYTVFNQEGVAMGEIVAVDYTPLKQFCLTAPDGSERLIPVVDDWFVSINAKKKTVIMHLPEGL
jgi:16S rRNA processing protein RimM